MPIITVAIPAYNAEKYIAQTIDSILAQTFRDWECVIVNDGSTDGTLAIIESYAAGDSRFRYITTPNSGSTKIPRSKAVELATGQWICSIDADDYMDSDYLQKLYDRAMETGAAMVVSRMVRFDENDPRIATIPVADFDMNQVISGREALVLTLGAWRISPAGALVPRQTMLSTVMVSGGKVLINNDEYDSRIWLMSSEKVAFADTDYHYRKHSGSITVHVSPKRFEVVHTDGLLQKKIESEYGVDSPEYDAILVHRFRALRRLGVMFYRYRCRFSPQQRREIYSSLCDTYYALDRDRTASLSSFDRKLLLRAGFRFFMFVSRIRAAVKPSEQ